MVKAHEALILALDALEQHYLEDAYSLQGKTITAIREALAEQPAKEKAPQSANCEAPGWIISDHARRNDCTTEQSYPDNFIDALKYDVAKRDSEAQPEQEPVRVPVTDNTYNYAKSLAEAIFKQHFASDEHYASGRIVWGVNDTVIGILTQIDNMVADMVRRPAQQQKGDK